MSAPSSGHIKSEPIDESGRPSKKSKPEVPAAVKGVMPKQLASPASTVTPSPKGKASLSLSPACVTPPTKGSGGAKAERVLPSMVARLRAVPVPKPSVKPEPDVSVPAVRPCAPAPVRPSGLALAVPPMPPTFIELPDEDLPSPPNREHAPLVKPTAPAPTAKAVTAVKPTTAALAHCTEAAPPAEADPPSSSPKMAGDDERAEATEQQPANTPLKTVEPEEPSAPPATSVSLPANKPLKTVEPEEPLAPRATSLSKPANKPLKTVEPEKPSALPATSVSLPAPGLDERQDAALAFEESVRGRYMKMDDRELQLAARKCVRNPAFKQFAVHLIGNDRECLRSFFEEFGTIEPLEELVSFECFMWEHGKTADPHPSPPPSPCLSAKNPKPASAEGNQAEKVPSPPPHVPAKAVPPASTKGILRKTTFEPVPKAVAHAAAPDDNKGPPSQATASGFVVAPDASWINIHCNRHSQGSTCDLRRLHGSAEALCSHEEAWKCDFMVSSPLRQLAGENPRIPSDIVDAWKEAVQNKCKTTKNALFNAFMKSGKDWGKPLGLESFRPVNDQVEAPHGEVPLRHLKGQEEDGSEPNARNSFRFSSYIPRGWLTRDQLVKLHGSSTIADCIVERKVAAGEPLGSYITRA